jgi:hypothetical protein
MITSLGTFAVAAATIAGGLTGIAAQAPAYAAGFTTTYTCSLPGLGARTVGLDGWLTSPGQTAAGRTADFQLHISSLSISSPIPIDSWSASAWIDVSGAEVTSFQVTGSGGYVPAGQPITGDLTGAWTPSANGTDALSPSGIAVSVNTAVTGNVTAQCAPNGPRPVAETLTVYPQYYTGWPRPDVPPYRPGWHRPIAPPYGRHRPIVITPPGHSGWAHHGEWSRPGWPPHHR